MTGWAYGDRRPEIELPASIVPRRNTGTIVFSKGFILRAFEEK